MEIDTRDETLLKRFLVRDVTADERRAVEDSYMTDDARYEELRALEDELYVDYLRGTLPSELHERLATIIEESPLRQRRLAEVRQLLQALPAAPSVATVVSPVPTRRSRRMLLTLSAAAVVSVGAGIVLRRLWFAPAVAPAGHALDVRRPSDVVFDLQPVTRTTTDAVNIFSLPEGTDSVTLTFTVSLELHGRGAFSLRRGDDVVVVPTRPVVNTGNGHTSVRWRIPAGLLPAGDYVLTVTGDTDGERLTRSFTVLP
jgi:ferric-dicitrate binding protein FerR (iron transport regulator)